MGAVPDGSCRYLKFCASPSEQCYMGTTCCKMANDPSLLGTSAGGFGGISSQFMNNAGQAGGYGTPGMMPGSMQGYGMQGYGGMGGMSGMVGMNNLYSGMTGGYGTPGMMPGSISMQGYNMGGMGGIMSPYDGMSGISGMNSPYSGMTGGYGMPGVWACKVTGWAV
uniref:Uncharacterized protein n=1 Tax=Ditylenchus dipsaci TaxID=166011 RepID=A0A915DHP0_9BILA